MERFNQKKGSTSDSFKDGNCELAWKSVIRAGKAIFGKIISQLKLPSFISKLLFVCINKV